MGSDGHLLLLTALDAELAPFFTAKPSERPAPPDPTPIGPWSCLNPVCEHRGTPLIQHAEPQPPDTNGTRHLTIRCPYCGFAYQVREDAETPTQAGRVVDYGPTWKALLRQQWDDISITLRRMATMLGVDPKTVKQRAADLGLPFPRPGKRQATNRGLYVPKRRDHAKRLEDHRRAWAELRVENPTAGTKALRMRAPALYAWLYRCDQAWLKAHQPARLPPTVTRVYVDWARRDEELAGQVATAAHHIKNAPGKPRQVTTTAIGRVLGKQSLFEVALAKLPLTRDVITHVVESGIDFAVRRVHAAAGRLRAAHGAFPRWRLVRAAGLHYRLERHPRVSAALDYEMRPPAKVVIFPNATEVPDDLLQRSTRLPRVTGPVAIIRPSN